LRGYQGSDLPKVNDRIRSVTCPFTGEVLAAVPAIAPDVTLVHAQRADRAGNVLVEGIVGVQKEAVLAARRSVVSVEEIVEDLAPPSPNSVVLPSWTIDAVAIAPRGAAPSYVHGYYARDNAFYQEWDSVSRDRERFRSWMEERIIGTQAIHAEG
jgi:glutaconate CoA-transferase, subunit A